MTMNKCIRVNISLSSDTLERLDQFACQEHTSRSHAITKLIWDAKVKNPQLKGQMTIDDFVEKKSSRQSRTVS